MQESEILGRIKDMVSAEHELRQKVESGAESSGEAAGQLRDLEVSLDQCWDLLRQRRAKREFGDNPDEAQVRPAGEVEGYLQ